MSNAFWDRVKESAERNNNPINIEVPCFLEDGNPARIQIERISRIFALAGSELTMLAQANEEHPLVREGMDLAGKLDEFRAKADVALRKIGEENKEGVIQEIWRRR